MKSVVVKYVSGVEEKFQSNKEKMGFRSLCVLQQIKMNYAFHLVHSLVVFVEDLLYVKLFSVEILQM